MLSFLIRLYAPIIITANYELTTLTDRWHYCEPNKLSFTIFGHLHNLLRFIKVQLKSLLNKHFLFYWKLKNAITARPNSAGAAQQWQRPSAGQYARVAWQRQRCAAQRQEHGPAQQWPSSGSGASVAQCSSGPAAAAVRARAGQSAGQRQRAKASAAGERGSVA